MRIARSEWIFVDWGNLYHWPFAGGALLFRLLEEDFSFLIYTEPRKVFESWSERLAEGVLASYVRSVHRSPAAVYVTTAPSSKIPYRDLYKLPSDCVFLSKAETITRVYESLLLRVKTVDLRYAGMLVAHEGPGRYLTYDIESENCVMKTRNNVVRLGSARGSAKYFEISVFNQRKGVGYDADYGGRWRLFAGGIESESRSPKFPMYLTPKHGDAEAHSTIIPTKDSPPSATQIMPRRSSK
jgi:hypothetical protein